MSTEEQDEKKVVIISGGRGGEGARGGNVILDSGEGPPLDISNVYEKLMIGLKEFPQSTSHTVASGAGYLGGENGEIHFRIAGKEVLRFDNEGRLFHNGELLGDDKELFVILRAFFGYMMGGMNKNRHPE
jgi:hypothetical protein